MGAIPPMYKSQKVKDSILGNDATPKDRAESLIFFWLPRRCQGRVGIERGNSGGWSLAA